MAPQFGIELVQHRPRDPRGRDDHLPGRSDISRHARLAERGNIGRRADPLRSRDPERAQLAVVDERQRSGEIAEHQRHVASDDVVEGRRQPLVRNVHHLDAGHALEQLGVEMAAAAVPVRGIGKAARRVLRMLDQLADRAHRQRWIDHQHEGNVGDQRDRRQIVHGIVG
jgi:hypothetical protein